MSGKVPASLRDDDDTNYDKLGIHYFLFFFVMNQKTYMYCDATPCGLINQTAANNHQHVLEMSCKYLPRVVQYFVVILAAMITTHNTCISGGVGRPWVGTLEMTWMTFVSHKSCRCTNVHYDKLGIHYFLFSF